MSGLPLLRALPSRSTPALPWLVPWFTALVAVARSRKSMRRPLGRTNRLSEAPSMLVTSLPEAPSRCRMIRAMLFWMRAVVLGQRYSMEGTQDSAQVQRV